MKQPLVNTLRDRISIVKMVETKKATGGFEKVETEVLTCRSNHQQISGSETEEGKIIALFTNVFTVRFNDAITKGKAAPWFVKDSDGVLYQIISVIEIVRKKYLKINTVRRE